MDALVAGVTVRMTEMITQRVADDCNICTIAMATGRHYEVIHEIGIRTGAYKPGGGTRGEYQILEALGLEQMEDFRCLHRGGQHGILSAEFFRNQAWGRRALMSVPSLNNEGGWHSIYWDGARLFDPNDPAIKKVYTRWDELLPNDMILFAEFGPHKRDPR